MRVLVPLFLALTLAVPATADPLRDLIPIDPYVCVTIYNEDTPPKITICVPHPPSPPK